jgi:hypothetical protein
MKRPKIMEFWAFQVGKDSFYIVLFNIQTMCAPIIMFRLFLQETFEMADDDDPSALSAF